MPILLILVLSVLLMRQLITEECLKALSEEYCCLDREEAYLIWFLKCIRLFEDYTTQIRGERGKELLAMTILFDEYVSIELAEVVQKNLFCK